MRDGYDCKETFRRLDDYLGRALTSEERALVDAHLEACSHCAREFDFEECLLRELRAKLSGTPAPPDLMDRISAALRSLRADEPA